MERFVGKVAIVTGASSGIGLSVAKELLKRSVIVVGLARRIDRLQDLSNEISSDSKTYTGKFYPLKCDLCNDVEVTEAFQWVSSNVGPVWILINNAGVLEQISLSDIVIEDYDKMFNTNVRGLLMCTKEAMKDMITNNTAGHIININSIAGHIIMKRLENQYLLYSASKHAARVISEGLRHEAALKKYNIKVSNISPGAVGTEMLNSVRKVRKASISDQETLQPEDVAYACVAVLNTSPNCLISELTVMPIHQST